MKRTPLPSHDWPDGRDAGPPQTCETCQAEWRKGYDDPPPYSCKREPLERKTPLSPVSDTNSGRAHQKDEAYREHVRDLPCAACGCPPPNDAAHARTWGSGQGDWVEGEGNLLALCRPCHSLQHAQGTETFRELTGVDVVETARETGREYTEEAA